MRAIGYSYRLGAHALVICGPHQAFMTIAEYIRQRRLSHVEMLLATTDFSIAQVAAAVGYRSDGRFAAQFKKTAGYTRRSIGRWRAVLGNVENERTAYKPGHWVRVCALFSQTPANRLTSQQTNCIISAITYL